MIDLTTYYILSDSDRYLESTSCVAVPYVASVLGGTGTVKDVISYAREFEEYLK